MPHFEAPALTLCDGPHSVCGVGFSLNLNKSISYLSLCLSLNSFWDETSRTWASLGPETRYCGFCLGSNPSHVGSSPKQDSGWVRVPTHGFKSQAEINGFRTGGLASSHPGQMWPRRWPGDKPSTGWAALSPEGHNTGLKEHSQTVTGLYLPRLLSLLVGQEAILSLSFFFLQELSDFSERPISSFLISLMSCIRHRVKSWKQIFPFSSAPSWFMISATDSSIFNWRQTINKSFLQKGVEQNRLLGETFELEKIVNDKKKKKRVFLEYIHT